MNLVTRRGTRTPSFPSRPAHRVRRERVSPLRRGRDVSKPVDDLSPGAQAALGENGYVRFREFREYAAGWNLGRGRPLSTGSAATLELFLAEFSDFDTRPSLFMTEAGNLELGWEDRTGRRIEIEFFPDRLAYFFESDDLGEEGEISVRALSSLLARLRPEAAPL